MTGRVEIVNGTELCLRDAHGPGVTISFQRTLRIPDDGRTYPLPPGLGAFPLRLVRDYASRVPAGWAARGGVFLPMYQREAMWLSFGGAPHALKIGVGKVCAVSGERWSDGLSAYPQNYVVVGPQPWLDGIASGTGTIRQFVAMPLGLGYTVEGQLTGEEKHGGIQLQSYPAKPGRLPAYAYDDDLEECSTQLAFCEEAGEAECRASGARGGQMGLAAGGRMDQKIYPDSYGLDTWDLGAGVRVYVHLVNSELWRDITGEAPPPTPVTARSYAEAGLPWFDLYDEAAPTLTPTSKLAGVKSVKQIDQTKSALPLQDDAPVPVKQVKKLWWKHHPGAVIVDDGEW
ncbi:MAG TPA: hypothetical protein VNO30_49850 [Kofleriaceae bacterium]|nr:hypothetical protein [Kofleriaceae bacterium]